MLEKSYFDSQIAYCVGLSDIKWHASEVEQVTARNGIFILREILKIIETQEGREFIYSSPKWIFGGTLIEIKKFCGVDYLVVNWHTKEVYWADCLFVHINGVTYRYEFKTENAEKVLKEFLKQEN